MNNSIRLGACLLAIMLQQIKVSAETDEYIKRVLEGAALMFEHPNLIRAQFDASLARCGYDTNRYERLMIELAQSDLADSQSKDKRICSGMLWRMGEVGTTNGLPFLYLCATNPVVGDVAVLSAFQIAGITDANMDALDCFLHAESINVDDKVSALGRISKVQGVLSAETATRTNLAAHAIDFAHGAYVLTRKMDESIIRLDSSYRYSRRRLGVMRSLQNLELNDYATNHVLSVISELVAYPESALGD